IENDILIYITNDYY
ncbi:nucleoside triphosphate phosphohydrolase, partial [Choristoneura fumiferana entomopoxvirus]